jgi:DNA-binding CsgD family transcriptional regulator
MVAVDEFSRLIAGIYAAAVTPQGWELALRDIHRAMGGTFATLVTGDHAVWSILDSTLPDTARESYSAYYHRLDYGIDAVAQGDIGAIRTGSELIDKDTEFYSDWLQPNGIGDGLLVRLTGGCRPQCFVVGAPPRTAAFETPDRIALLSGLIGHLRQALEMQARLGALASDSLRLAGALEVVRHGLLIVAPECLVINLNSPAERILRAADGLTFHAARVAALNVRSDRELSHAVHDAIFGAHSEVRTGRSFACPRPSGKHPYVLHVIPAHRCGGDAPADPTALVIIVDPEDDPAPPGPMLRRLYDLTSAEAEIALRVLHGAEPKQIADEMSIALATVRTHLQHVFEKTGTHRQSELVRLLLLLGP